MSLNPWFFSQGCNRLYDILTLMQKEVFRTYQRKALLLAAAVLAVVTLLFALGREVLLQSRVEQNRLRQQLGLQIQKELLEEAIEGNLVMLRGIEAFLAADEDDSLEDLELTNEIDEITESLRVVSKDVLGVVFVTGVPNKPWTSSYNVNFEGYSFSTASIPDLADLAAESLREKKICTRVIRLGDKALLIAVEYVLRDAQLWGFIFSFIDFKQIVTEFTEFVQLDKRRQTHLYLPNLGFTDWDKAPKEGATSVVLSAVSNNITLFQHAPESDQVSLFPIWIAIPLVLFIGLGSSLFTYALSFERAKSNWFSLFDPLLSIPNRRALEQQFSKTSQGHLLLFNIDNFKNVNEKYGFSVGDQVLIEVASRIQQVLSPKDFVARLGNDELVILPADPKTSYANLLSQRIQQAMTEPMLINRQMINITTIIGMGSYPRNGTDLSTLIEYADHQQVRDSISDQGI
jgi:diguanylate cyclase (GGDEF)-like protein